MKKSLLKVLTIIIAITTLMSTVTAVPATVTYTKRNLVGVNIQPGANSYYKSIKSGDVSLIGYCLNKQLKTPDNGTLSYVGEVTNPGLVYIFSNGHGGTWNTSLLGSGLTNDQRFYATQLAIWMHQGKLDANTLNKNDSAVAAAIKLANAAKTAQTVTPTIKIANPSTNITTEGTYYRSQTMTVTGNSYDKYTVTLVNAGPDAQVVTSAGQILKSGASINAGTNFYVRIPSSSVTASRNMTVRVDAVAKESRVYQYTTNKSDYQDIGILMANSKSVTAQTNLSITIEQKATAIVSKKDITTGRELAGATLQLKDSNGRVVDQWVSTTTPRSISNLSAGTYTLTEVIAPNGYVLNTELITFTLVAGQTRNVTMYNTPKTHGINIIKLDNETKRPLAGATLVLKDSTGKVIDQWVSTTSAHNIKNLAPGAYSVTETKAPTGYILNSTPVHFTITDNSDSSRVISIYNTPEKTTITIGIKISKQDITTKKELPGATLTLKDATGKVVATWVSTNTPHYIETLTPGKYTLIETKAPKGYGLSDEVIEFTINEDGQVDKEVIMYNSPIPATADINLLVIYAGFVGTIALGVFGMTKLSKQQ